MDNRFPSNFYPFPSDFFQPVNQPNRPLPTYTFASPTEMIGKVGDFTQGFDPNQDVKISYSWFNMSISLLNVEGYDLPFAPIPASISDTSNSTELLLTPYMHIPRELLEPYVIYFFIYQIQITQGWEPPQLQDSMMLVKRLRSKILNSQWMRRHYNQDEAASVDADFIKPGWWNQYESATMIPRSDIKPKGSNGKK